MTLPAYVWLIWCPRCEEFRRYRIVHCVGMQTSATRSQLLDRRITCAQCSQDCSRYEPVEIEAHNDFQQAVMALETPQDPPGWWDGLRERSQRTGREETETKEETMAFEFEKAA